MRLAVLGGGGFRVPLLYRAVARRPAIGIDELVLYDVDQGRLRVIMAVLQGMSLPTGPVVRIAQRLPEALRGADVVFSAIRVGGTRGRVRDEHRALRAGLLGQETVGLGGLAFGLRTLPVALAQARLIAELAPAAWVVSFTNPAGMITEALGPVLGSRVIGICDSPTGLVARACRALRVDARSVRADYVGVNHCGWLRALWHGQDDLLPSLLSDDDAIDSFEEGRLFGRRCCAPSAASQTSTCTSIWRRPSWRRG